LEFPQSTVGGGVVLITGATAGGPAAQAGLKTGDTITAVNGISLKDEDFEAKIAAYKSGSKVRIGYMRDSWALEATVTVGTNLN
jgi:S1-C subfamily serine protease